MAAVVALVGLTMRMPLSSAAGPTITGTGSSYAALAIDNWVGQVSTIEQLLVNYQSSSSVVGLNEFAQQQVDFGASEIGYSTKQAQNYPPAGYPYQYMPDVGGAICIMYNVNTSTSQPVSQLALTPQDLLGIFTGKITTWNDPQIQQQNPTIPLPNNPINVVYRTDASGENYILSDYFNTLFASGWNAFTSAMGTPAGPQAVWPTPISGGTSAGGYSEANWVGQSGSDLASSYVASSLNTITYVETGYALEHNKPCAYVQNASGQFVQPSEPGDSVALTHDQLQPDLEQDLTQVFSAPEPNAYPISAYSYLISAEGQIDPAKGAVFGQFVEFLACQGQQAAASLGYAPLPSVLVADDMAAVDRLAGHPAVPTNLTPQNCPNPCITGQLQCGEPAGAGAAPPPGITVSTAPSSGSGGTGGSAGTSGAGAPGSVSGDAGGTSATTGSTGSRQSSASFGSGAGTANHASAILNPRRRTVATVDGASAPPGQIPGVALEADVARLLGLSGPTAAMILWTLVFLGALVGPPGWLYIRQRRRAKVSPSGNVKQ